MGRLFSIWERIRSIARNDTERRRESRVLFVRDPELLDMAVIADRRKPNTVQTLDGVFEKVKPILKREPTPERPAREIELPAALVAKVAAMPDAEQRIRAIVEYKMSARSQADDLQKDS